MLVGPLSPLGDCLSTGRRVQSARNCQLACSITYYSSHIDGCRRCQGEYGLIDHHLAKKIYICLIIIIFSAVLKVGRHEL